MGTFGSEAEQAGVRTRIAAFSFVNWGVPSEEAERRDGELGDSGHGEGSRIAHTPLHVATAAVVPASDAATWKRNKVDVIQLPWSFIM